MNNRLAKFLAAEFETSAYLPDVENYQPTGLGSGKISLSGFRY
jgi:hypothetical protein